MILTDNALRSGIENGDITYRYGNPKLIGTNTIDVTLGRFLSFLPLGTIIDPQNPPQLKEYVQVDLLKFPEGYLAQPDVGYLGETAEMIGSSKFMPQMEGKSSLGRLFMTCHYCAGLGDVGFEGHWTLEILTKYPTMLRMGMKIGQIVFHQAMKPDKDYKETGRYTGSAGMEASKGV